MRSLLPLFAATAVLVRVARGQGDVTPWSCAGKSQVPEDSNGKVNSSVLFQAFPEPALVPWPAQLDIEADYLPLSAGSAIVAASAELWPLAQLLSQEIAAATDGELKLAPRNASSVEAEAEAAAGNIVLSLDASAATGASALAVTASGVAVSAASYADLVPATATLLQALERSANHDSIPPTSNNCSSGAARWRLPHITVSDKPQFGIRGVMVDAAREFLPLAALKGYVILCRLCTMSTLSRFVTLSVPLTWKGSRLQTSSTTSIST